MTKPKPAKISRPKSDEVSRPKCDRPSQQKRDQESFHKPVPDRHDVFTDEDSFWAAFCADLKQARARILLQSPFVTNYRMKLLAKIFFDLRKRGVTVCAYLQEPRHWREKRERLDPATLCAINEFAANIKLLRDFGMHVSLRTDIHAKLVIIDRKIFWDGSLNYLSHRLTKERINRYTGRSFIRAAITSHALENCPECLGNSRSYALRLLLSATSAPGSDTLGGRIARQRVGIGMTQRELAEKVSLTARRISQIENNEARITLVSLCEIAEHLDLEPLLVPRIMSSSVAHFLKNSEEPNS